jgi:AcrR family transcriptional regulator
MIAGRTIQARAEVGVAISGGEPNRAEARRAQQRERIFSAAEQLLVVHGVERTRLRDVGEAAGVSIGTVQHYFDTRDRLVRELFEWSSTRRLDGWLSAASGDRDAWERMTSLLGHALAEPIQRRSRIWIEFCAMARNEELREKLGSFFDAWRRPFREAIEQGIEEGVFRPTRPTDDIVDTLIMLVDGAEVAIALGAPGTSPERLRWLLLEAARSALCVDEAVVPRQPAPPADHGLAPAAAGAASGS